MAAKVSRNGRAALLSALGEIEATAKMCRDQLRLERPDWALATASAISIRRWLAKRDVQRVTTFDLLHKALGIEKPKISVRAQQDVGRLMVALGWKRRREPDGARKWFYERPQNGTTPISVDQQDLFS